MSFQSKMIELLILNEDKIFRYKAEDTENPSDDETFTTESLDSNQPSDANDPADSQNKSDKQQPLDVNLIFNCYCLTV